MVINLKEQQRLFAQSVATMLRTVLNVETEIVVKNWEEYEAAIREGDYDVVRRGLVMQTTDELTNIRMLFPESAEAARSAPGGKEIAAATVSNSESLRFSEKNLHAPEPIETESQALRYLSAMPASLASPYSLIQPH